MLNLMLLLGTLLCGLVLLAIGVILLFKVKNKLAGTLISAVGLVMTTFSVLVYLFFTITRSTVG